MLVLLKAPEDTRPIALSTTDNESAADMVLMLLNDISVNSIHSVQRGSKVDSLWITFMT